MFGEYIDHVLTYIEGSVKEKDKLKGELEEKLETSRAGYLKRGLSETEAMERVVSDFGTAQEVGNKLSYTTFKQRQWVLRILFIVSVLHLILTLVPLVMMDDVAGLRDGGIIFIIWFGLTIGIIVNNYLFMKKKVLVARFPWLLVVHGLVSLLSVSYTLPLFLDVPTFLPNNVSQLFIVSYLLLIVINMILGPWCRPSHPHFSTVPKSIRRLVIISNVLSGLLIISDALLVFWGWLVFGSGGNPSFFFITPVLGCVIWVISVWANRYVDINKGVGVLLQCMVSAYIICHYISVYA